MSKAPLSGCENGRLPNSAVIQGIAVFPALCCAFGVFLLCTVTLTFPDARTGIAWAQAGASSAGPAAGRDARMDELLRRMEVLEERLRESEAKREALTEEMQRLKAEVGERRPGLAEKPPSTGEAKAPGFFGGLTAGWDKGFYVRSTDGNFELRPIGILHVDFRGHGDERQINTDGTLATTFDIRRLRLGFEGFMFKDIGYAFEVNFDEDETELIFAYLNLGYIPWANLRVGQFKEPFSYEVLYPEKHLDFVERSNIATSVAPAENIGLMLHNLGKPYSGIIEYGIGVFNGEGFGINDVPNSDMEIASRLAVLPFAKGPDLLKKAKLAASVTYSGDQHRDFGFRPRTSEGFEIFPRPPVDGRRLRWGGDLQWFYGPFSLKAAYMRADEERNAGLPNLITDGWHVDATWLMTGEEKKLGMESGWELAARYEEIQVNAQEPFAVPGYVDTAGNPVFVTDSLARSLTLGLNKYLNYNVKVQVNYQHTWFDNPLLTPTSRVGDSLLESGDDSVDKIFMRMQLFF